MHPLHKTPDLTSKELEATEPPAAAAELRRTFNPRRVIPLLGKLGFTDRDIAEAVGASDRTVRRWRAGEDPAGSVRYWKAIDDLRAVVVLLDEEGTLSGDGIVHWARARNRDLDDRRPLEVLAEGGFDRVRRAAQRFNEVT
jgi:hypothetical protein